MSSARGLVVLAWTVPVLVLIQAILAGQAWFQDPQLFGLHGGVGHSALLLSIAAAGWSWFAPVRRSAAVLASVGVVAIVAQIGLGYTGHRTGVAWASSVHIPLGTAILALTTVVAVLVTLGEDQRQVPAGEPVTREPAQGR